MPGRRPIFISLVSDFYYFLRDFLYKKTIEPKAPQIRKSKEAKSADKDQDERKPW